MLDKKIKILFFIIFIFLSITFVSIYISAYVFHYPIKLHVYKRLFTSSMGPSTNSFDSNPLDNSINESGQGSISCRKFVPAQNWLEYNQTQSNYQDIFINLNPQKTAIVLIDSWDMDLLDDLVNYKIVPLLNIARKNNITIVHAVSTGPKMPHPLIEVHPEDIIIKDYGNGDKELKSRGIDTLLYAGQDTLYCVLDKPQGFFYVHLRGEDFRTILIRDGVISKTPEMKTVAINMFETKFGCSISTEDLYDFFEMVPPKEIFNEVVARSNSSFDFNIVKTNFKPSETALVLVNPFKNYSSEVWNKRVEKNRKEKLIPLINLGRSNDILIIYVSNKSNIANDYKLLYNEFVIYSEREFRKILKERKIKKLLYAGYALNQDVLFGPAGISRLFIQTKYEFNKIADYYIVEDATLAFEIPETSSDEIIKKTILKYYRRMKIIELDQLPSMIY